VNNLMLRQRHDESLTDYVHFLRQTFDKYNETCQLIDGSVAIHPDNLGLLMMRGISSSGPFGQAKQCVINAFDIDYLMSADEVMVSILHMAQNMDENAGAPSMPAPDTSPPPISEFVVAIRGSHSGRGHNPRGPHGGRGLSNKYIACGSLDHIMSSCTAPDDTLPRWTLAKWKMIVHKHGTPGGSASTHAALLSDVPIDESDGLPTLEDCTDEYDDTEVSVPFSYVAFSSSIAHGRDLSQHWVVDSACSINLTAFRSIDPRSPSPRRALAWVELVSMSMAVVPCACPFGWLMARLSTARFTRCTHPTSYLALLSASAAYLVSVGYSPTADVNLCSLLTPTMVCSWCVHKWGC
jgi:hypothetical protein